MTENVFYITCAVPFALAFFSWLKFRARPVTFATVVICGTLTVMVAAHVLGWLLNEGSLDLSKLLGGLVYLLFGSIFFYGGAALLGWLAAWAFLKSR